MKITKMMSDFNIWLFSLFQRYLTFPDWTTGSKDIVF